MEDFLELGGKKFSNRLFVGTGKFSSYPLMKQALVSAGAELVTVAVRRVDTSSENDNILDFIPVECAVMPNTSGARTADEAVRIARIARAAGTGNWVKLEVIRDNNYLLPDNLETLKAVETLVKEGFIILPYMSPDLSMARRMIEAGAAAVMPLGSPIGSNRGIKNRELIEIMIKEIKAPVIVDAGLGSPSQACECMEMGCAAVLVNTAIAISENPPEMAKAFSGAAAAGRAAFLAGLGPEKRGAESSSPLTGFLR